MIRGVLNINKPSGKSSYDVIRLIKQNLRGSGQINKIGHAGTLDPMANGVLLILFNEATKITPFLTEQNKEYIAVIRLGIRTDTDDLTGKIIVEKAIPQLTPNLIKTVLVKFVGKINQVPPVFSALRVYGRRLYALARAGEIIEPKPRAVLIHELKFLEYKPPFLKIKTVVAKGTYIRALARDIGEDLGCGATLGKLTRTRIGKFQLKDALKIDELDLASIVNNLCPIEHALADLTPVLVKSESVKKIITGQELKDTDLIKPNLTRLPAATVMISDSAHKILAVGQKTNEQLKTIRLIYADLLPAN